MATPHRTRSQALSDTDEADRPRQRTTRSLASLSPTKKRKSAIPALPPRTVEEEDDDEVSSQDARTSRRFEQPDPTLPPIGGKADYSYGSAYKNSRDSAAGIDHNDINADILNLVADKAAENVVIEPPIQEAPEETRQSSTRPVRSTRAASKTPSKATAKAPSKAASKAKTTRSRNPKNGMC
jgi:hypothetical protein